MRVAIISLMFLFATAFPASAQSGPGFLFDEYQDAIVYHKGGLVSEEKLNYDMQTGKLYFLDAADGMEKIVDNQENLNLVKIGTRNFVYHAGVMTEVLHSSPRILVRYNVKLRPQASRGAYGGTSSTSSVDSYSEYRSNGTLTRRQQPKMEVGERYNTYWVDKGGRLRQVNGWKQLLKLYPANKPALTEYIESREVDFEDTEAMLALLLYAEGL